jgi:hypothetical protein
MWEINLHIFIQMFSFHKITHFTKKDKVRIPALRCYHLKMQMHIAAAIVVTTA